MWLPMFDPLLELIAPPKPVLGIVQVGIVIDYGELSDEDNDSSERKHNPMMPRIVFIKKSCHE
jgi:hypothetical protein